MSKRQRADRLLVERGLFASRAKAQAAIAAGLVTANEATVRKASAELPLDASLRAAPAHPYVSRGGVKLAAALDYFGFNPQGRICLDVGRSQLDASLRARPEVTVLEQTDIRALVPARLAEPPDFVSIDVSFISLKLALPAALALTKRPAQLVALIKPQFEAGRAHLKKGIVRDAAVRARVCDDIAALVASLGWRVLGVIPSPIDGGEGNREFLLAAVHD